MLPASTERVPGHTDPAVNEKIQQEIAQSVIRHWANGRESINRRLEELDREWDIERAIEAGAAAILIAGLGLGAFVSEIWLVLPALVASFLLLHALQGCRLSVSLLRKLGFRATHEIDYERYALKALRGDFKDAPAETEPYDGVKAAKLAQSVRS